jgi:hypothetical protein
MSAISPIPLWSATALFQQIMHYILILGSAAISRVLLFSMVTIWDLRNFQTTWG